MIRELAVPFLMTQGVQRISNEVTGAVSSSDMTDRADRRFVITCKHYPGDLFRHTSQTLDRLALNSMPST